MKILAIGAHPDDIEIGCGGFLISASQIGHQVHVLLATRGDYLGNGKLRENEARESAKEIGVENIWFLNYKDTELIANGDLIKSIEEIIKKIEPDLIMTHSMNDEHHDHRAVGYATVEAARYVSNILCYENPLTKDFNPQVFIDISNVIEKKLKLLSNFQTQKEKVYLKSNAIMGLAQYRALQSRLNIEFAEAFQVIKFRLLDEPFSCKILFK